MKVLYALANHPQLSEMYVESEMSFVERSGHEVAVWSKRSPGASYDINRKVYRTSLAEAENDFSPDIVHFHWLTIAEADAASVKCPIVTVRGHSFDFNIKRIEHLASLDKVKCIFLFPNQAELVTNPKVEPLNVGYDSTRYNLDLDKNLKQVIRCCAARPSKGLFDFAQTAKLCPEFTFILCIAEVYGDKEFVPSIQKYAEQIDSPVIIKANVSPSLMTKLMKQSGIYYHTIDLPQNVGMCVSIAEGMACGAYTIARDTVPLAYMISGAGDTYNTIEEAAKLINNTLHWTPEDWTGIMKVEALRAAKFVDFNVFPAVIDKWEKLLQHP